MRRSTTLPLLAMLLPLAGCHSHFIQASITNASGSPLNVVQIDYPSASFGTQLLQPEATFHYRFKLLGSGPVKLTFVDSQNQEHSQTGPSFAEGQEGTLGVTIRPGNQAEFSTSVKP